MNRRDIIIPNGHWLYPEEQRLVVMRLLELGLLKFDETRSLILKSGGTTDIYINLREARKNPKATAYLASLFQLPLQRIESVLFGEIPEALSGVAGCLSVLADIPYLTFRDQPKANRVGQATVIGQYQRGAILDFIEDVVTDARSKIEPYHEAVRLGLRPRSIIVLVDRQQGWRDSFDREGIQLPVWSGMTLHDVRRELIVSGAMRRCDPEVEVANDLIVALDGRSWEALLPLLDKLRTMGCILKVNDLLFGKGIEHSLPELSVYGRVMADLKSHDIPNTVENICRWLQSHAPWAVTAHASGSGDMIRAAKKGLGDAPTLVLGITVLTSLDAETCEEVYARQPLEQVMALAEIAMNAGAHGLVTSPHEVAALRQRYPEAILVTPGIRPAGAEGDDQSRIATPQIAKQNGASKIVVGRPVLGANDPVQAVKDILAEMRG